MTISDKDRELLLLFCKRADTIASSSMFKEGKITIGLNVKWESGGPTICSQKGPTTDELMNIVTIVRQFYSPGETIHFRTIYNIVSRNLRERDDIPEDFLNYAESAMEGFKELEKETCIPVKHRGKKLLAKEIIDIWFNGHLFHADIAKVRTYEQLWKSPAGPMVNFIFRSSIFNFANLFIYFSGLIKAKVL